MQGKNKPKLICFELCPFAQRSVIILLEKGLDFEMESIDPKNKPDSFLEISPVGKVPVFKIGGSVLFESGVINEYLDEVNPPSLHPADPLKRALNRAWIEFGSNLFASFYRLYTAKEKEGFEKQQTLLLEQLKKLEKEYWKGPYFNGKKFSLVDVAYAPLFIRLDVLRKNYGMSLLKKNSSLTQWHKNLLKRSAVQKSIVPDFDELLTQTIQNENGYLATLRS